jgi:hypothetical protein
MSIVAIMNLLENYISLVMYLLTSSNIAASDPAIKKRTGPNKTADRRNISIVPQSKESANAACCGILSTADNCYKKVAVGCCISAAPLLRLVTSYAKFSFYHPSLFTICTSTFSKLVEGS